MSIDVKVNFSMDEVQAQLKRIETKEIPFAMALTATRTAQAAQAALKREIGRVFDNPTPWILNSTYVLAAKKSAPEAVVYAREFGGTPASITLMPQVEGGQRNYKRAEGALRAAGLLPNGWQVAPGPGMKRDKYGNISRGKMQQLLSGVRGHRDQKQNRRKGRATEYFVVRPGDPTSLHPGVWERVGGSLSLLLVYIRPPRYSQRLDWYGVANKAAEAELVEIATLAIDDIVSRRYGGGRGSGS